MSFSVDNVVAEKIAKTFNISIEETVSILETSDVAELVRATPRDQTDTKVLHKKTFNNSGTRFADNADTQLNPKTKRESVSGYKLFSAFPKHGLVERGEREDSSDESQEYKWEHKPDGTDVYTDSKQLRESWQEQKLDEWFAEERYVDGRKRLSIHEKKYLDTCEHLRIRPRSCIRRYLNSTSLVSREQSLHDADMKALAQGLSENSTLTYLDLSGNSLSEKGIEHLATALSSKLCSVTTLLLSNNAIGNTGFLHLVHALCQRQQKEDIIKPVTLDVSGCKFQKGVGKIVAQALLHVELLGLDISRNHIDAKESTHIRRALGNLGKKSRMQFQRLVASWNALSGPRGFGLLPGLLAFESMVELDLSWCSLSECESGASEVLCDIFASCRRLQLLDLSHNKLGPRAAGQVAKGLRESASVQPGLKELRLGFNPLGFPGAMGIVSATKRVAGGAALAKVGLENTVATDEEVQRLWEAVEGEPEALWSGSGLVEVQVEYPAKHRVVQRGVESSSELLNPTRFALRLLLEPECVIPDALAASSNQDDGRGEDDCQSLWSEVSHE